MYCVRYLRRINFINNIYPIQLFTVVVVFFNVNSVRIPNLLLYVHVNTSAMHFADASRIASSMEHDTLRFRWKILDYHMIFTSQFDRNGGSMGSIDFFALLPRAHLTLVSVRQWDAKKLRRFCKQDKAWRDIVGNKLSIRKIFLNIELPS